MRLDITGRHVEITAQLRQLIDRRLAKFSRLLNDSAISASVILTKEKYRHLAEIVIHARGDHMQDGTPVRIEANVELPEEAERARERGAEGIGLYRSEFLLAGGSATGLDEDAQYAMYVRLLEAMTARRAFSSALRIMM